MASEAAQLASMQQELRRRVRVFVAEQGHSSGLPLCLYACSPR